MLNKETTFSEKKEKAFKKYIFKNKVDRLSYMTHKAPNSVSAVLKYKMSIP